MKNKTGFFILMLACFALASCASKANRSNLRCGRLLTEKELASLSKTSYKDYQADDLNQLEALTKLVDDLNGDSTTHEIFLREKSASTLTMEIFGVEDPLQIEKTACAIFRQKELNLPAKVGILFHKYLNGGTGSEFLLGVANH